MKNLLSVVSIILCGFAVIYFFVVVFYKASSPDSTINFSEAAAKIQFSEKDFKIILREFAKRNKLTDDQTNKILSDNIKSGFVKAWFLKGGIVLSKSGIYESKYAGDRNEVWVNEGSARIKKKFDFGPRSKRVMVIIGKNGELQSWELPDNFVLDDVEALVFDKDKIYQFDWHSIYGTFYSRMP